MKHLNKLSWAVLLLLVIPLIYSACKKEEEAEVIASFTSSVDASNFKLVHFTNTSQNYSTVSWNFGDGSTSTEVSPDHTFADEGVFTVTMTATSSGGKTDSYTAQVTIADPNVLLTVLCGDDSKTWKLIRDVSTGRFPVEVGPWDHTTIWWAMGNGNDALAERPCMLNDEWTFHRDGTMTFNPNGDYWAEGGYFSPDNICASTSDPMVNGDGTDLSAWASTNHTFRLTPGASPKLTAIGLGAFIGYIKLGNMAETKVPLDSVQYNVLLLTDGTVDTLVIEGQYKWDAGDGGYWRHVLVHYDNPADEPPLPGNKPSVSYTFDISGLTVTFNNATTGAASHLWDFGDGTTSTEQSPVHTYTAGGPYMVQYSATNNNGTSTANSAIFVTNDVLTDALLVGGAWRLKVDNMTVFVGDGMGKGNWWSVPVGFLNGAQAGTTDDWSCMPDDEFIFSSGGAFEFKTMGGTRNDGYFGTPNGCWTDAQIAASAPSATSGNGSAFGSAVHSYTFTPASGSSRAVITLTSAAGKAAFLGFYKGYNGVASGVKGGENAPHDNPPVYDDPNFGSATNTYEVIGYAKTGSKEFLFVSVDISGDHSGTAAWSMILER